MPFVAYGPKPGAPAPPRIVVDLGFSSEKASCGVRSPGEGPAHNRNFGPMAREVRKLLRENPAAVLVLEAPLSGLYRENGSPMRRGAFEDAHGEEGAKGWYHGAAATVALAAQRLLTLIASDRDLARQEVRLAEAFLTRAVTLDQHAEVAQAISDHFVQVAPVWINGAVPLHPAVPAAPGVWVFTAETLQMPE